MRLCALLAGVLVVSFGGAVAAQSVPAANAAAIGPDHEILRALIEGEVAGRPPYEIMSGKLADGIRPQAATLQRDLTALGPILSLYDGGVDKGVHRFRVRHAAAVIDWHLILTADRRQVDGLWYFPVSRSPEAAEAQRAALVADSDADILARLIRGKAAGAPEYPIMHPGLAAAIRPQVATLQTDLAVLGDPVAIEDLGHANGQHRFRVQHANGLANWQLVMAPDRSYVTGLWYQVVNRTPALRSPTPQIAVAPAATTVQPSSIAAASALPATSGRLALVIGNSNYRFANDLKNPRNDAADMSGALGRMGFRVFVVTDGDLAAMERALSEFTRAISPGDAALVFYAGHGVQGAAPRREDGVDNYLVPIDAELADPERVPVEAMALTSILERLERARAGPRVVILDACRNNPFSRRWSRATRAVGAEGGLAQPSSTVVRGVYIAFATAPGDVAADNERGRNGLFTQELLSRIDRPNQSVNHLFEEVSNAVETVSAGDQAPWFSGSGTAARFVLNPR